MVKKSKNNKQVSLLQFEKKQLIQLCHSALAWGFDRSAEEQINFGGSFDEASVNNLDKWVFERPKSNQDQSTIIIKRPPAVVDALRAAKVWRDNNAYWQRCRLKLVDPSGYRITLYRDRKRNETILSLGPLAKWASNSPSKLLYQLAENNENISDKGKSKFTHDTLVGRYLQGCNLSVEHAVLNERQCRIKCNEKLPLCVGYSFNKTQGTCELKHTVTALRRDPFMRAQGMLCNNDSINNISKCVVDREWLDQERFSSLRESDRELQFVNLEARAGRGKVLDGDSFYKKQETIGECMRKCVDRDHCAGYNWLPIDENTRDFLAEKLKEWIEDVEDWKQILNNIAVFLADEEKLSNIHELLTGKCVLYRKISSAKELAIEYPQYTAELSSLIKYAFPNKKLPEEINGLRVPLYISRYKAQ